MPAHIYKLLSQKVKDALEKYNAEAIQKFQSTRNLHEINFLHDLDENTQDNSTTSNQDDQFPDSQESHPDQDLEPPMEFRVMADSRGYDDIIECTETPPDEKEDLGNLDKDNEEVKKSKKATQLRELQTKKGTETW